jgi:glycosyltransferase involved in cell wall biosynthesis
MKKLPHIYRSVSRGARGIFDYLITFGWLPSFRKHDYFLSLVAIAKNEGEYFKEWIEYHHMIGVEKFYIYDNESTDNTREILDPYIKSGLVEYIFWPGLKQQTKAYNNALHRFRGKTKWLAIIDLDEFINPLDFDNITDFLKTMPWHAAQVVLGWENFGSSDHKKRPDGLVIENFTMAENRPTDNKIWIKSIIKPHHAISLSTHTSPMLFWSTVDSHGRRRSSAFKTKIRNLPLDVIKVNHYRCKSYDEFIERRSVGDARHGMTYRNSHEALIKRFKAWDHNDWRDDSILRFLPALKKRMKIK